MELQPYGLIWASVIPLLIAGISIALNLGLARSLLWSSMRAMAQLWLLGIMLLWIFKWENFILTGCVIAAMTLIAAQTILSRVSQPKYRGILFHSVFSLVCGAWLFSFLGLKLIIGGQSLRKAEVILPITGLLLGNSLTGISLGLAHWGRSLQEKRGWIETRLAHGATRWEAAHPVIKESITTGMVPILNSMSVSGIVNLPGMMTGQILAGADPTSAVKYQIAILFLIAASTFLGLCIAVILGYVTLFNAHHQLHMSRFGMIHEVT